MDPKTREDVRLPGEEERRRALSPILSYDDFEPLGSLIQTEFGACSRSGPHRVANEDHYLILRLGRTQDVVASSLQAADLPGRFEEFAYALGVADGSGQLGAGALASRVALSTLAHMTIRFGHWNLRVDGRTAADVTNQAEFFVSKTSQAIERYRMSAPFLANMRSTLTCTYSAGHHLFFTHVGNSRAYLLRDGALTRLTRDHVPDQDASGIPVVDVERIGLSDQDIVLLCTSGVVQAVDDDAIADLLSQPRSLDDQCRQLVEFAQALGSEEDVTVIAAKYRFRSPRHPISTEYV